MSGPNDIEPWADGLDEVDPKEMAMGRLRARQEILGEVFGPERISRFLCISSLVSLMWAEDIPLSERDAWEGLGMDGETLEAKVVSHMAVIAGTV